MTGKIEHTIEVELSISRTETWTYSLDPATIRNWVENMNGPLDDADFDYEDHVNEYIEDNFSNLSPIDTEKVDEEILDRQIV